MVKSAQDIQIEVDNLNAVIFRFPHNEAYLRGQSAEPNLGGSRPIWRYVAWLLMLAGVLALLVLLGYAAYTAVWNSPLGVEAVATVTGTELVDGDRFVDYTYDVDGTTYTRRERSNRSFSSAWESGNAPEDIVYLSFAPGTSLLDINVEPFELLPTIFGVIFVGSFIVGGYLLARQQRRMQRLSETATHVVPGEITARIPGRGYVYAVYTAVSPTTADPIRDSVQVGKMEDVFQSLTPGAPVAVFYADDNLHSIL